MQQPDLLVRERTGDLVTRDAAPRPQTFDATARTIEAVIASRAPVARRDQRGEFDEVLDPAGLDLPGVRGVSVLDAHRQDGVGSVLGTVDDAWLEGDEVVARIRFSDRVEVQPVVDDIRNGVIRHLSVGYQVAAWRDGEANGRRTRTAARWAIHEASFVPVPADRNARTRGLPARDPTRQATNRAIRELAHRAGITQDAVDDLIDRSVSLPEAREEMLMEMMTRSSPIRTARHNDVTLDNPEARVSAMGDALYARVNPRFTAPPAARQFVGLTLPELARECLNRSGSTFGLGAGEIITRALETTSDFPNLLANVLNKTLREPYALPASGVRLLARETSATDFKKKLRVQLDSSALTLLPVGEHGEFKSGAMSDASESYKVDTFGRIFGISRQALVNDDLGGLADTSRRLGQQAVAFEAKFLVDLLESGSGDGPVMNDTKTLFHADHANLAGTGAAPSDTTLSAARLAMRKQISTGGALIAITPKYLVVPSELETAAEKMLAQIQPVNVADVNVWTGRLTLVVEPRLSDAKRWYLVADPAEIDGLEFARLAGSAQPDIQVRAGFEIDGVETRVRLDYGAGYVDWRGWYSNAGQ